ncbi:sulfite exporter TauE/SafE family protein [Rhodococcus spelaei]|uniref:Probable membrane transporter protein n=1 Tax=Rhodococcus spelaei TaxID=2546320 RepID=A0A541B9X1_9NOCA|nr:sulfite exporter TauE/SafE family protein [Rhodococcus spelaei]TQF69127.1 sulfite exporter TauE/SafE family protein [Rhodococcus spelaei]
MSAAHYLLLVVAGFGAGLVGFVTGLASIISYPALLAVGLTPVAANVTNTVAMVAVGVGGTANSLRELTEMGPRLWRWAAVSGVGGLVGALILLWAPAGSFETVVPYLVAVASLALLLQPRIRKLAGGKEFPVLYPAALGVVAIYGGYFGAGAGVIFLALTLICTGLSVWRATILKSFLLGIANLVAAIAFSMSGEVNWGAAAAMALGALLGGWCGPPAVKVIPPTVLRIAVALAGFGLAGWLALK